MHAFAMAHQFDIDLWQAALYLSTTKMRGTIPHKATMILTRSFWLLERKAGTGGRRPRRVPDGYEEGRLQLGVLEWTNGRYEERLLPHFKLFLYSLVHQAEERARKRVKLLLPVERRSPSPPTLPHLQSPSPPLVSPYPPPTTQHLNYSSFVMDKSVTHSFRSSLLDELEQATNNLIEGEATMRKAMGRLWQVIAEDADKKPADSTMVLKREEEYEEEGADEDERDRRYSSAPDLTPAIHKLFLSERGPPAVFEPSHFVTPEAQLDRLEKSVAIIRELQDDGREYVERLEEIREGLGDVRAQRNVIWDMVREHAVKELQDAAFAVGA